MPGGLCSRFNGATGNRVMRVGAGGELLIHERPKLDWLSFEGLDLSNEFGNDPASLTVPAEADMVLLQSIFGHRFTYNGVDPSANDQIGLVIRYDWFSGKDRLEYEIYGQAKMQAIKIIGMNGAAFRCYCTYFKYAEE